MSALLWTVVILLIVWVIIRDRSIWPRLFGETLVCTPAVPPTATANTAAKTSTYALPFYAITR